MFRDYVLMSQIWPGLFVWVTKCRGGRVDNVGIWWSESALWANIAAVAEKQTWMTHQNVMCTEYMESVIFFRNGIRGT